MVTVPMPVAEIGFFRQFSHRLGRPPVREVCDLLTSWIDAAERFIYVETQYFTSKLVTDALVRRMRAADRSKLELVFVLPQRPEALKEELAVGATQVEVLTQLAQVAREHGHALGVYNVASRRGDGTDLYRYIHSKLMIVDDCRLTLGSANLNNRSMSLDSEINIAWAATVAGDDVSVAVRTLRHRLLREHLGTHVDPADLDRPDLVAFLDAHAAAREGSLRLHDLQREEPSILMKLGQRIAAAYADPIHSPESRDPPLPCDGPAPSR
jgi:phosphatidylserine/phosphatidylglycerophosphate/cardiolipin synthase-like enzyme